MSEEELRDALLKQNGAGHATGPLDVELSALHRLIDGESRRVRRLTVWAVTVWAVWLLMIAAMFVAPMLAYQSARSDGPRPAATQPVATTQPANVPVRPHRPGGAAAMLGIVVGGLCVVALMGLPVVGVVLLILMILGRRTATTNQIRASLAELDAKLRLLTAHAPPAPSGAAEERRSAP